MDISSYLVELLRLYDCVIVPDLGGFVANYCAAEVDPVQNTFNPPKKEVVFNSNLNKNDGLLVNYISEREGVGYLEARQIVSEYVEQTQSDLDNGDTANFSQIGSLKLDRHGKMIFEPAVKENFLLDAYGLSGFHFPKLERETIKRPMPHFEDKEAVRVVFNSRRVKRLVVGIPLILALTLIPLSKDLLKNSPTISNQANSSPVLSVIDSTPTDNLAQRNETLVATPEDLTPSLTANEQVAATTEPAERGAVLSQNGTRYHLVGGSFKALANANTYRDALIRQGYNSEVFKLPNGFFRVTIHSYTDHQQALATLNELRIANPKSGIWILKE